MFKAKQRWFWFSCLYGHFCQVITNTQTDTQDTGTYISMSIANFILVPTIYHTFSYTTSYKHRLERYIHRYTYLNSS